MYIFGKVHSFRHYIHVYYILVIYVICMHNVYVTYVLNDDCICVCVAIFAIAQHNDLMILK